MAPIYLHLIEIKNYYAAFDVSLDVDFKIVGSANGDTCQVTYADNYAYVVAGGFPGLPYTGALGRAGIAVSVRFTGAPTGLVVATYQAVRPNIRVTPPMVVTGVGGGNGASPVPNATILFSNSNRVVVRRTAGPAPIAVFAADYPIGSKFVLKDGYSIDQQSFTPII